MKTKRFGFVLLGVAGVACLCVVVSAVLLSGGAGIAVVAGSNSERAGNVPPQSGDGVRVADRYGKLPLSFEHNEGQVASEVKFRSRGRGYTLFLTDNEVVLALRQKSGAIRSADLAFRSAAFPGLLRFSAAELETNSRTLPAALLPTAGQFKDSFAPRDEARIPNRESRTPAVLRMKLVGVGLVVPGLGTLIPSASMSQASFIRCWLLCRFAAYRSTGVRPNRLEHENSRAPLAGVIRIGSRFRLTRWRRATGSGKGFLRSMRWKEFVDHKVLLTN